MFAAAMNALEQQNSLLVTGDGSHTLISAEYGVTYHSRFGAVSESAHVFIGMGLRFVAALQRDIAILEIGFGTGLNAFMTLLEAEKRNLNITYTTVEAYPISRDTALSFNFAKALDFPERAADFINLHTLEWEKPHAMTPFFTFEKRLQRFETLHYNAAQYDLIYYDAFAPQAQPELWSEAIFAQMYAALRPDGILVTYCAQGHFKRTLKKVGFIVESPKGPPGKREMTRAGKEGF